MPVEGMAAVLMGLDGYVKGTQANVIAAGNEIADLLEAYAKDNHPWKDETGDTRESIRATIVEMNDKFVDVLLTAGTPYSVFLELAHSGKWAWLWPAVLANRKNIMDILQRNLDSSNYRAQQVTL
jgi:hypothetical protein